MFKHPSFKNLPTLLHGAVKAGWFEGSVFLAIMGKVFSSINSNHVAHLKAEPPLNFPELWSPRIIISRIDIPPPNPSLWCWLADDERLSNSITNAFFTNTKIPYPHPRPIPYVYYHSQNSSSMMPAHSSFSPIPTHSLEEHFYYKPLTPLHQVL